MSERFFSIPELDQTGGVKTLYTSSCDIAWNYEDAHAQENYLDLGGQLGIRPEDMVKSKQTHTDVVKIVNLTEVDNITREATNDCTKVCPKTNIGIEPGKIRA